MFEGFERRRITANGVELNLVTAGSGPPLLLLHGYPQTHAMWHRIAPRLAEDFTVVAADLRGYGASEKPRGDKDHVAYSKRTLALDQVELMRALGFERFAVAGHDRGARVAYRMALDHPERVQKLAVLDVIPTYVMFANVNKAMALGTYHWFFLAQPYDLPEHLIGGDPEYFIRHTLGGWAGKLDAFAPEALQQYIDAFRDPACIHATCEDYRAGATIDSELDAADLGKKKIGCPLLAIWGEGAGRWRGRDVLGIWREWASDVRGHGIDCGHFLAEEAPDETYAALREFFLT